MLGPTPLSAGIAEYIGTGEGRVGTHVYKGSSAPAIDDEARAPKAGSPRPLCNPRATYVAYDGP